MKLRPLLFCVRAVAGLSLLFAFRHKLIPLCWYRKQQKDDGGSIPVVGIDPLCAQLLETE